MFVDPNYHYLALPSDACKSSACTGKKKYTASKSSTSKQIPDDEEFSLNYYNQFNFKGTHIADSVTLGDDDLYPITVTDAVIYQMEEVDDGFKSSFVDGILGVGIYEHSDNKYDSVMVKALIQGLITGLDVSFVLFKTEKGKPVRLLLFLKYL